MSKENLLIVGPKIVVVVLVAVVQKITIIKSLKTDDITHREPK